MCQHDSNKVLLHMMIKSMHELARQVRVNAEDCQSLIPQQDAGLGQALSNTKQTAVQLEHQLQEIKRLLEQLNGKGQAPQLDITFF